MIPRDEAQNVAFHAHQRVVLEKARNRLFVLYSFKHTEAKWMIVLVCIGACFWFDDKVCVFFCIYIRPCLIGSLDI